MYETIDASHRMVSNINRAYARKRENQCVDSKNQKPKVPNKREDIHVHGLGERGAAILVDALQHTDDGLIAVAHLDWHRHNVARAETGARIGVRAETSVCVRGDAG
jgi:hypothetical protein